MLYYNIFKNLLHNNVRTNTLVVCVTEIINATFASSNCLTVLTCAYPESDGNCSIEYGQDPSHQDLNPPLQTSLNSPITLPVLESSQEYYYQITANISPTLRFLLRGSFRTESCE